MNIKIESLKAHHIAAIMPRLPDYHAGVARAMQENPNYAEMMSGVGPCAAFIFNGEVLAVAGLVDFTPSNRCFIWCCFATNAKQHFAKLVLAMRSAMRMFPRRRYEAYIHPEFANGKRLVKWAKFSYEGLMRSFEGDGSDRELWALVKEGV